MERIAASFLKSGHQVTVSILNSNLAHPSILKLKNIFGSDFDVFPIDDALYTTAFKTRLGEAGHEIAVRKLFENVYKQVNKIKPVEYVFLPFLDYCLYAVGMLGSPFGKTKWVGICMRPSFQYSHFGVIAPRPKLAAIKQWLFFKLLRIPTLVKLFTIDELLAQYVVEQRPAYSQRIQYLPDPAELIGDHTYASARQALGIADGTKVVLVYGAIDERKGLDALVHAAADEAVATHVHVLIVGKQTDWAKNFLAIDGAAQKLFEQKRLHMIDSFVDDSQQQMVFSACDAVWLGYKNHYTMSGVLVLAEISRKFVIANTEGLIGWYVNNNLIGVCIDIFNNREVISSLNGDLQKINFRENISSIHSFSSFLKIIKSCA